VFSRGRRVWGAVPASEEGFTQSDGVQVAPHRAAGPPEVPFPRAHFRVDIARDLIGRLRARHTHQNALIAGGLAAATVALLP